jgi:hypothetical protein
MISSYVTEDEFRELQDRLASATEEYAGLSGLQMREGLDFSTVTY